MNSEVSVVRDTRLQELRLYTDYGRCSRPLFIVEGQRLLLKKSHVQELQTEGSGYGWNQVRRRWRRGGRFESPVEKEMYQGYMFFFHPQLVLLVISGPLLPPPYSFLRGCFSWWRVGS